MQKVRKFSAEAQAAGLLRDGIVSGEIAPGERLTEIKMAENLGVSRATIRAAFHQLVQEGLIVQIPYTGWEVMSLSAHDAWELFTLRSSLEALAARLVANKVAANVDSKRLIDKLDGVLAALSSACKSKNENRIAEADFSLHREIVGMTGHRRLMEQYGKVEQQIRLYIASSDSLIANPDAIFEQHIPLISTLKAGDAECAATAAMQHNEEEGKKLVEHLENLAAVHPSTASNQKHF